MIGAGEDHAFHAVPAGRFVDVEHAADIGAEDFLERSLDRYTAEMHDRVDAFDQFMYGIFAGQVADLNFFTVVDSGRHFGNVRKPQHVGVRAQSFAQYLAQATCRAGQQEAIEGSFGGMSRCHERSPDCYFCHLLSYDLPDYRHRIR